jgi:phosphoribosylformimino-5-aminoimidazole carboxamide ribotide isomerase
MPRIIPVIDVMEGRVVRAVGGRRELYEPIRSRLIDSTEPLAVAERLLQVAGSNELYVADLDAIQGHRPQLDWLKPLIDRSVKVMIDAGLKIAADAIPIAAAGAVVVAGSETLRTFDELAKMIQSWEPPRVVLSIDLKNGTALGTESDPAAALERGRAAGVSRFIVLELARVGTSLGPGTSELIRSLRAKFPDVELLAGGGVRGKADIDQLLATGADGVLVASALHDGAKPLTSPTA